MEDSYLRALKHQMLHLSHRDRCNVTGLWQVTIISDGIGCRRENDGMHCLRQMQYFGADIVPLETYLFSKLKSSDHPCFKDISRLIKSRE